MDYLVILFSCHLLSSFMDYFMDYLVILIYLSQVSALGDAASGWIMDYLVIFFIYLSSLVSCERIIFIYLSSYMTYIFSLSFFVQLESCRLWIVKGAVPWKIFPKRALSAFEGSVVSLSLFSCLSCIRSEQILLMLLMSSINRIHHE